ncbi:MAG: preprotein translocase subunit SecE [Alphaproteobacteria bacterium]
MTKTSPAQFIRQVRQEMGKVTWPSRRETTVSTSMVLMMVLVASLFFLVLDQILAWAVKAFFGLGG